VKDLYDCDEAGVAPNRTLATAATLTIRPNIVFSVRTLAYVSIGLSARCIRNRVKKSVENVTAAVESDES
jgi:hypothetical protein